MLAHMAQCQVLEWQHCNLKAGTNGSVPGTGMATLQSEGWHKRLSPQYKTENTAQCTAQSNSLSYYNFSNLIFNLPSLNTIRSLPLNMQHKAAPWLLRCASDRPILHLCYKQLRSVSELSCILHRGKKRSAAVRTKQCH